MMTPTALWTTWQETASQEPAAPVLLDGRSGESLDRRTLHRRAEARADDWGSALDAGPAADAPPLVAFAEPNGFLWLELFLALQRRGAVALPLDPHLPEPSRTDLARRLGARWLFSSGGARQVLPARPPPPEPLPPPPGPSPTPDPAGSACLVKLTSGSTGEPQPLSFTAEQMLADGRQIIATMGLRPGDVHLAAVPLGHSYGLGNLVLPLILQGAVLVCSAEMLPAALGEQIRRFGVTVLPTVPAVLRALGSSVGTEPAALATLRTVISAGAPLRPEVAATFQERFGCAVHNFYGTSETGGICYDQDGEATRTGRAVGRPLRGVEVACASDGRITVRSAAVHGTGTHVVGDRGEWNERGELRLVGRATTWVNIGGKKVDPAQVEQILRGVEGVQDALVGVAPRLRGGGEDYLWAAVETGLDREALLRALAGRLPAWQIPRRLLVSPGLARTERGKLDRQRLEEQLHRPADGG